MDEDNVTRSRSNHDSIRSEISSHERERDIYIKD